MDRFLKYIINSRVLSAFSSTIVFGLTLSNFALIGFITYFLFGVIPYVDVSYTPLTEIQSFQFSPILFTTIITLLCFIYFYISNLSLKYIFISLPLAITTKYFLKIIIIFGKTRSSFSDHYVDFLGFIRLTHHYSVNEKIGFINDWRRKHGDMIISNGFLQELLGCNRVSEMTSKLNDYTPGIYELKKYTIFGAYRPIHIEYIWIYL